MLDQTSHLQAESTGLINLITIETKSLTLASLLTECIENKEHPKIILNGRTIKMYMVQ